MVGISEDGATVTLRGLGTQEDWPTPRGEILRPLVSEAHARALLDRLALPGAGDAPLPAAPEGRALIRAVLQARAPLRGIGTGPEAQALWDSLIGPVQTAEAALDAWVQALPLEDLIDDIRNALAVRVTPSLDLLQQWAVGILVGKVSRMVFLELAAIAGRSIVEVEYALARGPREAPPRALVAHAYLGSFTTKGRLVASDFCHLNKASELHTPMQGKPGRYHAWVSWSASGPSAREQGLLVVHEDALDQLDLPTRRAGRIHNDSGMVGVYDADAAADSAFQSWLTHAADFATVLGITSGCGVQTHSEGDGGWDVRAAHVDRHAVVIRVVLSRTATGKEPIQVVSSDAPARTYAPRQKFEAGESVEHPKFGRGNVLSATKESIEVAFADTVRKLVHGL